MAELTPIEKLDKAIQEFAAEISTSPRILTGWVLGYSTIRFDDSGPDNANEVFGMNYALGGQTHFATAVGLTQFLNIVSEKEMWKMLVDNEDEED